MPDSTSVEADILMTGTEGHHSRPQLCGNDDGPITSEDGTVLFGDNSISTAPFAAHDMVGSFNPCIRSQQTLE